MPVSAIIQLIRILRTPYRQRPITTFGTVIVIPFSCLPDCLLGLLIAPRSSYAPPICVQTVVDGFCDRNDPSSCMFMSSGVSILLLWLVMPVLLWFPSTRIILTYFLQVHMYECIRLSVRANSGRLCAPLRLCLCALRLSSLSSSSPL